MKKSSVFILIVSLLLVLLAFAFHERLSEFKSLGLFGIFLVNLFGSATIFLPAPAIASVFAGGIIYSPFMVAFVASIGSAVGEIVGFLIGHSGKEIFLNKHHILYKAIKNSFLQFGSILIFVFAFVPNPFFDVIGILAGIFSFSPRRLIVLIFLGRFLRNILLALTGAAFSR